MKRIRVHVVRRGHEYAIWAAKRRWGRRTLTYVGGHSVLKAHVYGQNLHMCSDAEADFLKKVMLNAQYHTAAEYLHEAAHHSLLADAKVPGLAGDANALLNSDWLDIFNKQVHARFDIQ